MAILLTDTQTALGTETVSTPAVKYLYESMYFLVDTTVAAAGTLDIEVEWSLDGTTWLSFSTPDTFTQITTTGQEWLAAVPGRAHFFRLTYASVTGPFTFEVSAIGF